MAPQSTARMAHLSDRSLELRRERAERKRRLRDAHPMSARMRLLADFVEDETAWWGNDTVERMLGYAPRLQTKVIRQLLTDAFMSPARRMDELTDRQRRKLAAELRELADRRAWLRERAA